MPIRTPVKPSEELTEPVQSRFCSVPTSGDMKENPDQERITAVCERQEMRVRTINVHVCVCVCMCVCVCRERPAQPAGGADQPAVRPHAAPGERAGARQAVR